MLNRSVLLRAAIAGAVVSLAGCGMMRPSNVDVFEAAMSGGQEVPPVTTSATGHAEVQYNRSSGMLSWRVTHSGLSGPATGGHIHGPAAPGQNASVLIPFTNPAASPVAGEAHITTEQLAQLNAGQWYVNLHTTTHPGGEIRGQLRPRR